MGHAIEWFDIPVVDFDRARKFYGAIFGRETTEVPIQKGWRMALLPNFDREPEKGAVGGGLIAGEGYVPTKSGVVLYLNAGGDMDEVLNRIEGAGGKILTPKHKLGDYGFLAYFEDSEGNRLGLRSRV